MSSSFAVMASSERMDWPTPRAFFDALNAEFEFTVDACARPDNAKVDRHWSEVDEGLMQPWAGERVYMNPPYGRQLPRWVEKAWNEQDAAQVIVALIPARVDTSYWHDYIFGHAEIRFLRGRITFEGSDNPAPFPSAVVVWRPFHPHGTETATRCSAGQHMTPASGNAARPDYGDQGAE